MASKLLSFNLVMKLIAYALQFLRLFVNSDKHYC